MGPVGYTDFEVKVRGRLGPDEGDEEEATVIGRAVRQRSWGIEYAADPRHKEEVMKNVGFSGESKGLSSTGKVEEDEESELEVEAGDAIALQAVKARVKFLAQDRSDIQFGRKFAAARRALSGAPGQA